MRRGKARTLITPGGSYLNPDTTKSSPKPQIDALLLKLPGVSARTINSLDAYFVSDRMFACISGDGVPAGHRRCPALSNSARPRKRFLGLRFRQARDEGRKRRDVRERARLLERIHVLLAPFYWNHRPNVARGNEHQIHQESREPAVSIHVRVDIDKKEVTEDCAYLGLGFRFQKFKGDRHAIPHRLLRERNVQQVFRVAWAQEYSVYSGKTILLKGHKPDEGSGQSSPVPPTCTGAAKAPLQCPKTARHPHPSRA